MLLEYFDEIHNCPSYLYHSALPFSPSSSWLHECYIVELSQEVRVVEGLQEEWGMCSRIVLLEDDPLSLSYWNNTIAIRSRHNYILILDAVTGSQTAVLPGHTETVTSLTFSSDGTSLISGSHDKTVKLWDVQTGGNVKTFYGHTGAVQSVSISVDHTTIASGSGDKTIRLWDIQTGECCQIIEQQDWVHCVMFSPTNPKTFISTSGSTIQQWDISGHKVGFAYDGRDAVFSPDGTHFISCVGQCITIQNANSGVVVAKIHNGSSFHSFSPDGRLMAITTGCDICIYNMTGSNPHLVKTFAAHTKSISSLAFSSPPTLISASCDRSVKFWQIGTSSTDPVVTNLKSTPLVSAPTRSITLRAKNSIIIPSNLGGVMKTWGILTSHCKGSPQIPAQDPHQTNIQPSDSKLIFVWYADRKINIWDAEEGELLQTINVPEGNVSGGSVEDLRVSGDGSMVFYLYEKSIQAWNILTGEVVGRVEAWGSVTGICIIDGSELWVGLRVKFLRWDFGISGSPVKLFQNLPKMLQLSNTKLWEIDTSRMMDVVTGKVVFQLPERFGMAVHVQWGGQYLVASFRSKEVLILDLSHMLLQ